MKYLKRIMAVALSAFMLAGCSAESTLNTVYDILSSLQDTGDTAGNSAGKISRDLSVYYLDVGQGDSEYIELPDGKTMLIDAGTSESGNDIISFIQNKGTKKLDYVVATHPHADHIGSMAKVLQTFDIGQIYMPDASANTKTFEKMLDVIEEKNIPVKQAKAGVSIISGDELNADIIAPNSAEYDELNDYSAVVKLNFNSTSFLFMGDAEALSEGEITSDVQCDVVKIGHHGSKTSSSQDFVNKTKAKYAIVSVGKDNSYGLPKDEILKRWETAGAKVIRTDKEGTICFVSDGNKVERKNVK